MTRGTTNPIEPLGEAIHVWILAPARVPESGLSGFRAVLSPDEVGKVERLRVERARLQRLVTRGLLRNVLSLYAAIPPRAWRFQLQEHGRPVLVPGQCDRDLRFNVSHTEQLVVCAVTEDREIGVDVEWMRRRGKTTSIADRFFAPSEVSALHAMPAGARRERFFDYWTLKEAYIKARGLGLALPLRHFSFDLADAETIRIEFDPQVDDDASSWQFERYRPTPDHALALAVRRPSVDAPVRVRSWPV